MQRFFRILGIINTIGMVIALLGATFGLAAASVALEDASSTGTVTYTPPTTLTYIIRVQYPIATAYTISLSNP